MARVRNGQKRAVATRSKSKERLFHRRPGAWSLQSAVCSLQSEKRQEGALGKYMDQTKPGRNMGCEGQAAKEMQSQDQDQRSDRGDGAGAVKGTTPTLLAASRLATRVPASRQQHLSPRSLLLRRSRRGRDTPGGWNWLGRSVRIYRASTKEDAGCCAVQSMIRRTDSRLPR